MKINKTRIAYFITPHGFGHATRACAGIAELASRNANLEFEIFTTVPKWLFEESLIGISYRYNYLDCDLGLVQKSPFQEDIEATLMELRERIPFGKQNNTEVLKKLESLQIHGIVCDIAPMGIYFAEKLGVPSVLVENFTWDWIYSGYNKLAENADKVIKYLEDWFTRADLRIQTEPVCLPSKKGRQEIIQVKPVARRVYQSKEELFKKLEIPEDKKIVSISMGGIEGSKIPVSLLEKRSGCIFILPNTGNFEVEKFGNRIELGRKSRVYHPDLIAASDLVVGKMGYSTYSETYCLGIPFLHIKRDQFRESFIMETYASRNSYGSGITEKEFLEMKWLNGIQKWINMKVLPRENGVVKLAKAIEKLFQLS
mgnify:CR=1 FL=1